MEKTRRFLSDRAALNTKRTFIYIALILLSLICILPFYLLIINSTRGSSEIQQGVSFLPSTAFINNFQNLLENKNIPVLKAFGNSLFISLVSALLTVYFSALTAFGIHMYNFKGKKVVFTFILAIMMIPTQVASVGLVTICYSIGLFDNYIPLILPAICSPITFFFMKQYMQSNLPFEMVEAARVDGASEFRIFNSMVLPIMKPALAVQFIFAFVANWNNFFLPAMLIKDTNLKTLPLIIAQLKLSDPSTFDLGQVYVLMFISIIPMVIVYIIFSKFIIKGVTLGSVKG